MELWKETINKVYFDGEQSWGATATYEKNGVSGGSLAVAYDVDAKRFEATLPYILEECKVVVVWTFTISGSGTFTKRDTYDFVTPYVTLGEIRDALNLPETVTDSELRRAERRVRGVINTFTGQTFGRFTGTLAIQSNGESGLNLPQRLISFSAVNGAYFTELSYFETRGDGWYLNHSSPTYADGDYVSTGVIRYPGASYRNLWRDNVVYSITGEWGYEDVPEEVKESALILIEDMLCPDSEYRDRYIDSVKTADYQYMYTSGAFRGTGSVVADQLLATYIRPTLAVI